MRSALALIQDWHWHNGLAELLESACSTHGMSLTANTIIRYISAVYVHDYYSFHWRKSTPQSADEWWLMVQRISAKISHCICICVQNVNPKCVIKNLNTSISIAARRFPFSFFVFFFIYPLVCWRIWRTIPIRWRRQRKLHHIVGLAFECERTMPMTAYR